MPRLFNRDNPLVVTPDSVCGSWVLAWTGIPKYPYRTQAEMLHQLKRMEENGWAVLFERANIELLHRSSSGDGGYACKRNDPLLAPE